MAKFISYFHVDIIGESMNRYMLVLVFLALVVLASLQVYALAKPVEVTTSDEGPDAEGPTVIVTEDGTIIIVATPDLSGEWIVITIDGKVIIYIDPREKFPALIP